MFQSDSQDTYLVNENDEVTHVNSSICCFNKRGTWQGVSVQSGDIQRVSPEEDETVHVQDEAIQDIAKLNFKEKLLHTIHQTIYKVVKIFFSNPVLPFITLLLILVIFILLFLLACFVYPPQLDLSLRSFQIPNHESSLNYDAFQMALHPADTGNGEESGTTRHRRYLSCTQTQTMRRPWKLDIFYRSKDGKNTLTKDRLSQIHNIEQNIVNHKHGDLGYEHFCHKSSPPRCDPLNSLLTFFYPSYDPASKQYIYDGNGDHLQDIDSTLAAAFQSESSYWYGDFKKTKSESKYLRSQLRIGVPLPGYCQYSENAEAIHKEVTEYFISFIPYLDDASTE